MESRISRHLLRILTALALVSMFAFAIAAQDDPDPNSPTPVLLTESGSTRIIAQPVGKAKLSNITAQAFPLNSTVMIFLKGIKLADKETAAAFRVYAIDRDGHEFVFPVLDIQPYAATRDTYTVTIQLTDAVGYWDPPAEQGNLALYLTWRGLASNKAHISIGQLTDIQDIPAPKLTAAKSIASGRPDAPDYVGYKWSGDRIRFLEQATFGPTAALDLRIRRIGIRSWLAEQFDAQYPSVTNPFPSHVLKPVNQPTDCDNNTTVPDVPATCFRDTYTMYPQQQWFMSEALNGEAQLRHRVAWALSQIWVTSGVDIQQSRHMTEYYKVLSANAFGNYRTLMKQMTLNSTMGDYLDMARSTKANPNENYAREIMQLFTVGLVMLHQDGTPICVEHNICQPGDTPMATYDQNNVNSLTKVMTGWGFCPQALGNAACPNVTLGTIDFIDPLLLNTANHDVTAKTLLNYTGANAADRDIAACTGCTGTTLTNYANASLDHAIDNMFNHPNVGPFISLNLIRQMVTSNPSPQYVSDVAGVFNDNGFGVRGDMKAVVKAILLHPEARGNAKTDPNYGKLREPVQYATNLLRTLNVRSADGLSQSDGWILGRAEFTGMNQIPFRSPTVFNYFPPDYVFSTSTGSIIGPEFALMTTGTSIQRANFVNRMIYTVPMVAVGTDSPLGTSINLSDLQALATTDGATTPNGTLMMDELNRRMMHGTMSASMRSTILTAVNAIPATSQANFLLRAQMAVHLIASSSQYQVQR